MSYKDKTYVIFDGDKDMWAYAYMKGWKSNSRVDFDFEDAHDLKPLTLNASNEYYIKSRLKERMKSTKQVIVLLGESTRYLFKYVRWEIELAQELDLPIIVVNLNNLRSVDNTHCPAILKLKNAVHVSFNMRIIKHSLDNYPFFYHYQMNRNLRKDYHWETEIYLQNGL